LPPEWVTKIAEGSAKAVAIMGAVLESSQLMKILVSFPEREHKAVDEMIARLPEHPTEEQKKEFLRETKEHFRKKPCLRCMLRVKEFCETDERMWPESTSECDKNPDELCVAEYVRSFSGFNSLFDLAKRLTLKDHVETTNCRRCRKLMGGKLDLLMEIHKEIHGISLPLDVMKILSGIAGGRNQGIIFVVPQKTKFPFDEES
jgi:hypothetical protein